MHYPVVSVLPMALRRSVKFGERKMTGIGQVYMTDKPVIKDDEDVVLFEVIIHTLSGQVIYYWFSQTKLTGFVLVRIPIRFVEFYSSFEV